MMNKEVAEVFERLNLFKLDMNKNIEDLYNRLYITFDDNEITYLLDYIEDLQQRIDKIMEIIELNQYSYGYQIKDEILGGKNEENS